MATETAQRHAAPDSYERGYNDGFARGYDLASRGRIGANMVLIVMPREDPLLHDRVRDRIHQVLADEGLLNASVVDLID